MQKLHCFNAFCYGLRKKAKCNTALVHMLNGFHIAPNGCTPSSMPENSLQSPPGPATTKLHQVQVRANTLEGAPLQKAMDAEIHLRQNKSNNCSATIMFCSCSLSHSHSAGSNGPFPKPIFSFEHPISVQRAPQGQTRGTGSSSKGR